MGSPILEKMAAPRRIMSIVPSDGADLADRIYGINVSTAGNVAITTPAGDEDTIYVAAGIVFPVEVIRVRSTGTTAAGIKGLFY